MPGERYVLLGLASPRSSWFRSVAQWANAGTIPAEFVKCVSAEEMRARLASGRPFSAALVDAGVPALDRDLVDTAGAAGCAVIAVERALGGAAPGRDLAALGVSAVLADFFDPKALLDALAGTATMVARGDTVPGDDAWQARTPAAGLGEVAVVCGPGGTGASTVAIALAQGLAADRSNRPVVLADLALHAEQAMLHDARDVVPGVQELVDAHRLASPPPEEVRSLTFDVEERGYHLLLGLRRASAWTAIRPRALRAAFDGLRSGFRIVVCDADAELEGEDVSGSVDVEERHTMARTAALNAGVVFAVGLPGMKGLYSLVRVLNDLRLAGVDTERIVPVVNRAPRAGRARAEITATVHALAAAGGGSFGPPMFLGETRLEKLLRDGLALPESLTEPLAGAFGAVVNHVPRPGAGAGVEVQRVRPGSLGSWAEDDDEEAALG